MAAGGAVEVDFLFFKQNLLRQIVKIEIRRPRHKIRPKFQIWTAKSVKTTVKIACCVCPKRREKFLRLKPTFKLSLTDARRDWRSNRQEAQLKQGLSDRTAKTAVLVAI